MKSETIFHSGDYILCNDNDVTEVYANAADCRVENDMDCEFDLFANGFATTCCSQQIEDMVEDGEKIQWSEAAMAKHARNETTFYFKGDKAQYTGKVEEIYGGTFYEFTYLEGHKKGTIGHTSRRPITKGAR